MRHLFKFLMLFATALPTPFWLPTYAAETLANDTGKQAMAHTGVHTSSSLSLTPAGAFESLLHSQSEALQHNQTDTIAHDLLTLTRGAQWTDDPLIFLSDSVAATNGTKDFKNAQSLGFWLGTLRIAVEHRGFESDEAADWFSNLLVRLQELTSARVFSTQQALVRDIARNNLSLNEALELITYGDVTSSSITTVIGQGIRTAQRHLVK